MAYTIDRLQKREDFTPEVEKFFLEESPKIAKMFDDDFDWRNFDRVECAEKCVFLLARKDGVPCGYLIAALIPSFFDPKTLIFSQQSLYVKDGFMGAAHKLFKTFIDIGKVNANHIITMIASQTNIKPRSLERLGFKKLETLYRLEV